MDPLQILKDAAKETPAVNYVWGVLAAAAALTVIIGLIKDLKIAFVGICVLLALVIVYFVITQLVQDFPGKRWLTGVLAWVVIFLFLAFLVCLFTSFVFGWPPALAYLLGTTSTLRTTPVESNPANIPPQTLPTSMAPPLPRHAPQLTHDQRTVLPGIKQPITIESQPDLYFISGMVRDVTKRDSLDAGRGTVSSAAITIINKKTGDKFETSTDNWGSFSTRVPEGRYIITAAHPDYLSETTAHEVKKSEDINMLNLEMKLKPDVIEARDENSQGFVIGSTFTEDHVKPIAGVHVTVRSKDTPSQPPLEMTTRVKGDFLFHVQHGAYLITLEHPQYEKLTFECHTKKGSRCDFQRTELQAKAK